MKKIIWIFGELLLILLFSSCVYLPAEELYSLPKKYDSDQLLQEKIKPLLAAGASYSAPTSGSNRQSVQLHDLTGEGEDEVVAFFNAGGEKPLKIYIFKWIGADYEVSAIIEGEGTSIASISYADLNGDGMLEIVVTFQVSTDVKMLKVYSLENLKPVLLSTKDCFGYAIMDLTGDGVDDLVVIRRENTGSGGTVALYDYSKPDWEPVQAPLSKALEGISRIRSTNLLDGRPALLIEGPCEETYKNGLLTDVFAIGAGGFSNVSIDKTTENSEKTIRTINTLYSTDINGDGRIEVPSVQILPAYNQGDSSPYYIDWINFYSSGERRVTLSTFRNASDGWSLILPAEWILPQNGVKRITIRRSNQGSGQRAVIFSYLGEAGYVDFLTIYKLTSDERTAEEYITLYVDEAGGVVYGAEITDSGWQYALDEADLKDSFFLNKTEWNVGELN